MRHAERGNCSRARLKSLTCYEKGPRSEPSSLLAASRDPRPARYGTAGGGVLGSIRTIQRPLYMSFT